MRIWRRLRISADDIAAHLVSLSLMIVDKMSAARRRSTASRSSELSDQQRMDIREAFTLFSKESNVIASKDLKLAMRALGFEPRRDEIRKIVDDFDKAGSGYISLEQFITIMSEKITEKDAREEILKAFRLFDDDQTGRISFKNLQRVAGELGENLTHEELREMIQEADQDNDGEINQEEFLRIMKKTCLY